MSDSHRNESADTREQDASAPVAEPSAEAKRIAARRRFLTRGAAGSGFVVLTLLHQRTEAWTYTHILSLPYTGDYNNKIQAQRDCASFARGRPYSAQAAAYEGQSPGNLTPKGKTVWYCG